MLKERKTFVYKNRWLRNFEDRIVAPLKHKLSEESMKTMEDDIVKNIENIDSKIQNTFIKQLQKVFWYRLYQRFWLKIAY